MADVSIIDQVYAEARDDLNRLLPPARQALAKSGTELAAVELASGLIRQPEWTRIMLASVLGAALVRLAAQDHAEGER
ncbi:MAG TPA: hypothetical protein VFR23_12635 [Jiangellaceae bacterium]|nr:hypothetical protein [Jiangellaceae bacterium]